MTDRIGLAAKVMREYGPFDPSNWSDLLLVAHDVVAILDAGIKTDAIAAPKNLEDHELHVLTTAAMNRATAEGLEMTIRVKAKRKARTKP